VIEEYTRPARLMENGFIVTRPALTDREWMHFDQLGTLENFNTDGLRSLLFTMPHIKNQKEKTLRYPGHVELIIALKESGFFDTDPIYIKGQLISPIDFSSQILFKEWKLGEEERELTIMKILIHGQENGQQKTIEYNLLDRYDDKTKISSMSRTTGYTCTASVNLIATGLFNERGVFPPELVGKNADCFNYVMHYLGERNVQWNRKEN
jgi:saccharopine dehydrogenase-like NADP-dependent oxidoreductase